MIDVNHTCDDFRRDAASTYTVAVPKTTTLHNEATMAFYNHPFLYIFIKKCTKETHENLPLKLVVFNFHNKER